MKWIRLAPAVLVLALMLIAVPVLIAGPDGTIRGKVTSGTGDGGPVPNTEVELLTLLHRQGPPVITTTLTDEQGNFVFEGVESDPQHVHILRVKYAGQTYFSDLITFEQDQREVEVPIVVYETTHEDDQIGVRRTHLIVEFGGNQVFLAQMYFVDNNGDRTFVGDADGKTLYFALPPEATNLKFQDPTLGESVIREPDGFWLNQALKPGETQVLFSYALPYHHPQQQLTFTLSYDVPDLVLLVSDIGEQVEAPGLTAQGTRSAQGASYYMFSGKEFPAHQTISLNLSNLPPPQSTTPNPQTSSGSTAPAGLGGALPAWVGLVMLLLGGVAAFGFAMTHASPASALTPTESLRRERDRLVRSIARLDEQFESGRIGQGAYRRERAALKRRLIGVLRQLRG